jgi:hypothetical protein
MEVSARSGANPGDDVLIDPRVDPAQCVGRESIAAGPHDPSIPTPHFDVDLVVHRLLEPIVFFPRFLPRFFRHAHAFPPPWRIPRSFVHGATADSIASPGTRTGH